MRKLMFLLLLPMAISCGGNTQEGVMPRSERLQLITEMEKDAFKDVDQFDTTKALALVNNYALFASENPKDEMTPNYLFKAADLSMALENSLLAISYFDQVIDDYSDFDKMPYCMFLKPFVYEDQLKDMAKAKESYEAFIDRFPEHDMADAARFSIKNLGKSPEELIREFEQKQDTTQAES